MGEKKIFDWATYNSVTALFEGVRRIVSVWKFARMFGTMCSFYKKNFGSVDTSYANCMTLLVPFLCICALFSVATSVNMNFNIEQKVLFKRLDKLYRLVPHLTWMNVCYWSYGHYSQDGQDGRKKSVDFFHFFSFIVNRPWKKWFLQKKYGSTLIHRDMTVQWYISRWSVEFFTFWNFG